MGGQTWPTVPKYGPGKAGGGGQETCALPNIYHIGHLERLSVRCLVDRGPSWMLFIEILQNILALQQLFWLHEASPWGSRLSPQHFQCRPTLNSQPKADGFCLNPTCLKKVTRHFFTHVTFTRFLLQIVSFPLFRIAQATDFKKKYLL